VARNGQDGKQLAETGPMLKYTATKNGYRRLLRRHSTELPSGSLVWLEEGSNEAAKAKYEGYSRITC
jgi:hypothetical protein